MAHIQKAPFTLIGLKLRDKACPWRKEKHPQQSAAKVYSVQCPAYPHISVSGDVEMANDANATPSNIVSTARALFDKRWINKA